MKKSKATIVLALLLALSFVLAACRGGGSQQNAGATPGDVQTETSTEETKPEESKDELPFVQVEFYYPAGEIKDLQIVQDEINKTLREKYNADLIFKNTDWSVYGDRVALMLSSREAVGMLYDATFLGWLQNVGRNSYMAVDDLLAEYGKDIIATTLPINLEAPKVNGVSYGICVDKDLTQDMGFYFSQEYADMVGITSEETSSISYLEDMEPMLARAKEKLPAGVTPIFVSITNLPNFLWAIGGTRMGEADGLKDQKEMYLFRDDWLVVNYETGKITPVYDFPSFLNQAELIQSWFKKGYINADAATTQMTWSEPYIGGTTMTTGVATITPMHHGFTENTGVKTLKEPIVVKPGVITGEFGGPCLPVACPNPERAVMIVNEFHANVDIMNMWTYGLEGIHFTKVSDNVIEKTERFGDYSPGTFWMLGRWFGGPFNSIYTTTTEDPMTYSNLQEYNRTRFVIPLVGFSFNTEPVKTEIAAHRDVMSRYMASVCNGVVDPGPAIETMRAEDQAAGIDKIITEYEAQYAAYKGR